MFLKMHSGKGYSLQQLSQMYRNSHSGINSASTNGGSFLNDFWTGFKMPFQAINKVVPISTLASLVHPAAGVAAKAIGLGKPRKYRKK
jgi:hypothetical protein